MRRSQDAVCGAGVPFGRWAGMLFRLSLLAMCVVPLGCNAQRTQEPKEVEIARIAEALTASDWPTQGLVVSSSIQLDTNASVNSDVIVRLASSQELARSSELVLESGAKVAGSVKADVVYLGTSAQVTGNAAYNTKTGPGQVLGTSTTSLTLPVSVTVPALPTVSPGGTGIIVNSGTTVTKGQGAYGAVNVAITTGTTTRLILSGGTYHFASISVGIGSRLECSADCEVRVNDRVWVGNNAFIGASGSGLTPGNMRLVVKGANDAAGPNGTPAAVGLLQNSSMSAYLLAPNGTLRVWDNAVVRGRIVGKDVYFGPGSSGILADLPAITQQPAALTVRNGQTASFTVVASGVGLTYQWFLGPSPVAGGNSATLAFTASSSQNGNNYYALITNSAGTVQSNGGSLTVLPCASTDTTCDGQDDDCNGTNDEDYVPNCGQGTGAPRLTCSGGAVVSTPCSDSNACNGTESCSAGACQAGTPPVVNDNNPCTTDSCQAATGVVHTPVASGTSCADSTVCNGSETCNASGTCVSGSPLVVNDNNPCTTDSCNAVSGVSHQPVASGTQCPDGDLCNGNETCNASGACIAGTPPVQNDNNPCTADYCIASVGVQHSPYNPGQPCPDGNLCNGNETCNASAACIAGTPPTVSDGNPCTTDSCSPSSGVQHAPVGVGTACPDGDLCNGNETCNASAVCVAGTPPVQNDNNPCTADYCVPVVGVQHSPYNAGQPCPDGNLCNGNETCNASAVCIAGTPPVVSDNNPCTTDSCSAASGVSHQALAAGASCTDGDVCNGGETCNASAVCIAGTALNLDDNDPCTGDWCHPTFGVMHAAWVGNPCPDGNLCNGDEVCGLDAEFHVICAPGTPPVLDDNNPCTADSCDPVSGAAHTPVAAGTSCGDGNTCNGSETCDNSGSCVPGNTQCTTSCIASGLSPSCAGFASSGFWRGQTWAVATEGANGAAEATVNVASTLDQFPLCVTGVVNADTDGGSLPAAMVGWNVAQELNATVTAVSPSDQGLDVQVTNFGASALRIELHGLNAAMDPNQRWCASVPSGGGFVPYSAFVADCQAGANGAPYANEAYATVVLTVLGSQGGPTPFEFCLNSVEQSDRCVPSLDLDDGDPLTLDRCDPVLGPVHVPIPEVKVGEPSTVLSTNAWLVEAGVQQGVQLSSIEERRAGLVRGSVKNAAGLPVANVRVSVAGRPEFGTTTTHGDGTFDFLVNGDGTLEFRFDKTPQYLVSARTARVDWNTTAVLQDVILMRPDPKVSRVALNTQTSGFDAVTGSQSSDTAGTRSGTLLFPPGVEALMVGADGSSNALPNMNVRITEFTVGDSGRAAMPAGIAYNTAYTYAFEVNADEAVLAGAPEILFSEPLPYYVHNFRGFPVGIAMPVGTYDRARGQWVPENNGVVLAIIGQSAGLALLDLDGDNVEEDAAELSEWGITDAERAKLSELIDAGTYSVGGTVWRLELSHFTMPVDANLSIGLDESAKSPSGNAKVADKGSTGDCETENASTIECESQVFRETIDLVGVPHSLTYTSRWVPDRKGGFSVTGSLLSGALPPSLRQANVELQVAGQRIRHTYGSHELQGGTYELNWNGRDQFGRRIYGLQAASVSFCYEYPLQVLAEPAIPLRTLAGNQGGTFGKNTGSRIGVVTDLTAELCRQTNVTLGAGPEYARLGEWGIDVHHQYLPALGELLLGDGTTQSATSLSPVLSRVVGGTPGPSWPFDQKARSANLSSVGDIALGPNGAMYLALGNRIGVVSSWGLLSVAAGGGSQPDESPAKQAELTQVRGMDVGSDGTLYFAQDTYVRKVTPDGIVHRVAGIAGSGGTPTGDGGPALNAYLGQPWDVKVAPDGSLYIVAGRQVRRIDGKGIISRIAGLGGSAAEGGPLFSDDPIEPLTTPLNPVRIAFSPSGELYILHSNADQSGPGHRLYKLSGGKLVRVAGCITGCSGGIGSAASSVHLDIRQHDSLAVGPDDQPYFVADIDPTTFGDKYRVVTVDRQGVLRAVGDGTALATHGQVAAQASIDARGVAFGPLGMYVAHKGYQTNDVWVSVVNRTANPIQAESLLVASELGDEVFEFDSMGRHLRTLDPYTKATRYSFGYSDGGGLETIVDQRATVPLVTTITRNGEGNATQIIGPYGHITTLNINWLGQLESVTDVGDRSYVMAYTQGGLLQSFTAPSQQSAAMTYDSRGRLLTDKDFAESTLTFTRTELAEDSFRVEKETELGRVTQYEVTSFPGDVEVRRYELPDGSENQVLRNPGGSVRTEADGTVHTWTRAANDRWGAASPDYSVTTVLPSGLTQTRSKTTLTVFTDPLDPLSIITTKDTFSLNGKETRVEYNASARQFTTTSPGGRISSRNVDSMGRTTWLQVDGIAPIDLAYDSRGRLLTLTQASRVTQLGYQSSGNGVGLLATTTDPELRVTSLTRDLLGRVTSTSFEGQVTSFSWDAVDNMTSLTPPGRPPHGMGHTPVDLLETYTPPALPTIVDPATHYTYDADRAPDLVSRPDGVIIDFETDDAGRLSAVEVPTGTVGFSYFGPTENAQGEGPGKLKAISGPYGTTLLFTYDGPLVTRATTTSSHLNGEVSWGYNNDFAVTTETLTLPTGTPQVVSYGYDLDLLPTCASPTTCPSGAGALGIARSPQNGMIEALTQDSVTESWTYNSYGELATQTSVHGGTQLLSLTYDETAAPRDRLGRIKQKKEVRNGTTRISEYQYDVRGQLEKVWLNGTLVEEYTYDSNGNRLSGSEPGSAVRNGTYDAQDRLEAYGEYAFEYTANGELKTKTNTQNGQTTSYTYDAFGNLRRVDLPNGTRIDYITDGRHRRIAKKVNDVIVRQWLYQDGLRPIAELNGSGALQYRYVYGSMSNSPDYVIAANGTIYRVLRDQLGSPLLVVNTTNASDILLDARYSAFGTRTVMAGNGSALSLGFAGGIYDEDTGLTRFGARDYDAMVGRWTAKDPILWGGGQGNLYAYVGNDPINLADPSGLVFNAPPNQTMAWLSAQADAWYQVAGENWLNGDYLAAVGPAALGALVEVVPIAVELAATLGGPAMIERIERHGPPPFFKRHAHGWTGRRVDQGKPWSINEDGTPHDGNMTKIPKEDAARLRDKGFNVPPDGCPQK